MNAVRWHVRPVRPDEFDQWAALFRGYAEFYQWELSEAQTLEIWRWIHEDRTIEALVALGVNEDGDEVGPMAGLSHVRTWVRPLRATVNGYLDDLYVDPEHRGTGCVDAMFDALRQLGAERGWSVVRWTTAQGNIRAQAAYDRVASRTTWVTYDLTVE